MKSLKKYSMNITEEEYHSLPYWSHSLVARYAREGFSSIATLHDRFTPAPSMEFGSLFDSMLTKGKATLDEYVVSDTVCPPAEKRVLDRLAGIYKIPFENIPIEQVIEVMNDCDYQMRLKDQTRYGKVLENSSYYNTLISGKKTVSSDDWADVKEMYKVFRNDPYLRTIFGTQNTDGIEYIYQAKFVVNYTLPSGREVQIKFMPDLLIVNHIEKTIRPVDLKTSSMPAYDFKENFLKFRYDIEANLYTQGLILVLQNTQEYSDYKILPYLFTDISRVDKIPVTYEYDPMDMSQQNGLSFECGDKTYSYKGWQVLLDEIIDYEEAEAKVPVGIVTTGPNDLLTVLRTK